MTQRESRPFRPLGRPSLGYGAVNPQQPPPIASVSVSALGSPHGGGGYRLMVQRTLEGSPAVFDEAVYRDLSWEELLDVAVASLDTSRPGWRPSPWEQGTMFSGQWSTERRS